MTLGEIIRETRAEELDLTVHQLAEMAEMNASTLSKIEREVTKDPGVFVVAKIAKALDVTVDYLLRGEL